MAPLLAAQWWLLIALGGAALIGAKLALIWFFVIRTPKRGASSAPPGSD